VAGQLVEVCRGRTGVENLSDRVASDVKTPDGPLETVRPGSLLSPAADRFQIHVVGTRVPLLVCSWYQRALRRYALLLRLAPWLAGSPRCW
jgi:hypothetical protein